MEQMDLLCACLVNSQAVSFQQSLAYNGCHGYNRFGTNIAVSKWTNVSESCLISLSTSGWTKCSMTLQHRPQNVLCRLWQSKVIFMSFTYFVKNTAAGYTQVFFHAYAACTLTFQFKFIPKITSLHTCKPVWCVGDNQNWFNSQKTYAKLILTMLMLMCKSMF